MLVAALATSVHAAPPPAYPFRDPSLPLSTRVDDLLGRLTPDQKISLLHQYQPAIPRPAVHPVFKTGTEALHGVAWSNDINNNGNVVAADGTMFPQAVGHGQHLGPRADQAGGLRGRPGGARLQRGESRVWGLNLWAPVVNLLRNPRWGRNEEGYSEDPYLTGRHRHRLRLRHRGQRPDATCRPRRRSSTTWPTTTRSAADVTSSNVPPRVLNEYDRAAFKPARSGPARRPA